MSRHGIAISPRKSREFYRNVPPSEDQRAQGMPGARCARSRAWWVVNTRVSHHGHTGITRHSPRNGFNGFLRTLPGDRACLPPSPRGNCVPPNLTPASGRQDHTTSPSASHAIRQRRQSVHRIPHPTSVTIAKRPSGRSGTESGYSCFYLAVKWNSEIPKLPSGKAHNCALSSRRKSSGWRRPEKCG